MGAENVLDIEPQNVAWHLGKFYINIYVYKIVSVRCIDYKFSLALVFHVVLNLVD